MNELHKNIPASVRQRLSNLANERGIEFQRILVLYGIERLLYRISASPVSDRFVLKGASLFSLWLNEPHRRTRDMDLLGKDRFAPTTYASLFQQICSLTVEDDGLRFGSDTVKAVPIREENEFGGVRVTLTASLGNARISIQVDIGFGDASVPEEIDYPTLLTGFAVPHLLAYRKETAIAEKVHTMVVLDRSNSRMKDFFDVYVLSEEFEFTLDHLSATIRETFNRRTTEIPASIPAALTQEFANDRSKLAQWKAFLNQNVSPPRNALELPDVIQSLAAFLVPALIAAREDKPQAANWIPGGVWQ
jgi:hypothetical protein